MPPLPLPSLRQEQVDASTNRAIRLVQRLPGRIAKTQYAPLPRPRLMQRSNSRAIPVVDAQNRLLALVALVSLWFFFDPAVVAWLPN